MINILYILLMNNKYLLYIINIDGKMVGFYKIFIHVDVLRDEYP